MDHESFPGSQSDQYVDTRPEDIEGVSVMAGTVIEASELSDLVELLDDRLLACERTGINNLDQPQKSYIRAALDMSLRTFTWQLRQTPADVSGATAKELSEVFWSCAQASASEAKNKLLAAQMGNLARHAEVLEREPLIASVDRARYSLLEAGIENPSQGYNIITAARHSLGALKELVKTARGLEVDAYLEGNLRYLALRYQQLSKKV